MNFGNNTEFPIIRHWGIVNNMEIDMDIAMEQDFPMKVVPSSSYATHSRALHRAVVQRPLRCAPWHSNTAQVERSQYRARRRSSIALAERLLRSAAQRCSVAQRECHPSQRYKYAQAERALRYAARRFRASRDEISMCYTTRSRPERRRRLVVLFECSLQYTVPRRCIAMLVDRMANYFPGRYSVVNAPGLTFYHRILRSQEAQALYFYWAVHAGVKLLMMRSAHVNYLEARVI